MLRIVLIFGLFTCVFAVPYTSPEVLECDVPGTKGLFISDEAVSYQDATNACTKHNGILADVSNKNFLLATDMVINCIGENQNAWIRSWDYNPANPEVRNCLAIHVGFASPGGGINSECNATRYALCSNTTEKDNVQNQTTPTISPPTVFNYTSSLIRPTQLPDSFSNLFNDNQTSSSSVAL